MFQISSFFTSDVTLDFIVDGIPSIILAIGRLSNLYTRIIYIDKVSSVDLDNVSLII